VNSHLEGIPGLGTFTTRGLSGGDLESLGWETDRALDTEVLGLGTLNELLADLLEGCDLSGGEGDTDLVGFLEIQVSSRLAKRLFSAAGLLTGPSPNSPFSGLLYDILT
jgi:hypothetical protein